MPRSRRSWLVGVSTAIPVPTPRGSSTSRREPRRWPAGRAGRRSCRASSDESPLWERVESDEMPPKSPLPAAEKAALARLDRRRGDWGTDPIDPYQVTTSRRAGRDWWSLQPVRRPDPPTVRPPGGCERRSMRLCFRSWKPAGWRRHRRPTSRQLIRRLSFDLTGLPPTPEEVDAFLNDRIARCLRAARRSLPRLASVRCALGAVVARPGPLR